MAEDTFTALNFVLEQNFPQHISLHCYNLKYYRILLLFVL